jgi:hypothetical protein
VKIDGKRPPESGLFVYLETIFPLDEELDRSS